MTKEQRISVEAGAAGATRTGTRIGDAETGLDALVAALPGIRFRRVMDGDGTISYPWFNASTHAILGLEPGAVGVNSKGCLTVVHWADRDDHLAEIRRSAATMTPCAERFRAITAAGEVRWLMGISHPSPDDHGGVLWHGLLIDVTAGRRAELRFDMLMEHGSDSIFVLNEEGRIDVANAAAERLFGFPASDLAGQPFGVLLAGAATEGSLDAAIVGGGPRELTGRRRDGSLFPLELSTEEVRLEGHRLFVGIGRDITQRKRTEAALRDTEKRLRAIAANMPGMVFQRVLRADDRLDFTYVSEGCRTVLGRDPEDLLADPDAFLQVLSAEQRQQFLAGLRASARSTEPFEEELAVADSRGHRRWLRGLSRPSLREDGDVVWDGVLLDVTDRKVAEQRLSFLAYYDPLTRLPNRAAFMEHFEKARRDARAKRTPLAVLSLGIDRFGVINGTMGHTIGDQVLIAAADHLQAAMEPGDVLARSSGDRFLALLAGQGSRRELFEAIERLHGLAQTTVSVGREQVDLSASVGAALFPRDGEDCELLVRNADAALQRAKGQGPGTLQFFTTEMGAKAARTLSLQTRLRRGLDNGEFLPYYQPQVDLATGAVVGMEALVRWQTADGMIAPGEFIPIAEDCGLIDAICEMMLAACARQNRAWQEGGLPAIPVAVNVSGRQFQYARRLLTALEATLADTGLEARYLEVELTESSAMRDADNAIAVVQQIRDMGIGCAIDDFGTGYSSLSELKRFPIHKLKIDRSFVMDVISDPNDAAIVDAIVAMAKALRLTVVAEGVEHRAHLEFLRSLGCHQMQGYFFSRPLSAEKMGELLAEGKRLHLHPQVRPNPRRSPAGEGRTRLRGG